MSHACYVCNYQPVPDGEGVECPHCHRMQYGNECPSCRQTAPTLVHDLRVMCSAYGFERGPLSGATPVNLAGQTSRVGSWISRGVGWALLFASVCAGGVGLLAMTGPLWLKIVLGAPSLGMSLLGLGLGWLALRGGRKLARHGHEAATHAREQAIRAMAAHRGGSVTAPEVATQLNLQLSDAQAALDGLATDGAGVTVDVDVDGKVHYRIRSAGAGSTDERGTGIRVVDTAGAGAEPDREQIRESVDREFEAMRQLHGRTETKG